jgi:peptidoglycan/LPS O-acetylase OafA/YrhL
VLRPTRIRDLLGLALLAAVVAWLLIRSMYGSLPPIPGYAGASLYPVAALEVVLAFMIRSRIGKHEIGDGPRQLHPITAARAVALAKASALVGAASAGIWAGFLLFLMPQRAVVQAAVEDTSGVVVGALAGVALVAAALWLEHCCKTPEDPDEDARDNPAEPAT